jgi:hypothetical protein
MARKPKAEIVKIEYTVDGFGRFKATLRTQNNFTDSCGNYKEMQYVFDFFAAETKGEVESWILAGKGFVIAENCEVVKSEGWA